MSGSLRETKPGVWELRVSLGLDPVTRRYRQVSRTFRGTKRAAEKQLALLIASSDRPQANDTDATLGQLLDAWIAQVGPDLSPTTRHHYTRRSAAIKVELGDVKLRKLRSSDLDGYYRLLRERGLKPASIRLYHATLSGALSQGVRWGWIAANPARDASPPRVGRSQITSPSPADVLRLIDTAMAVDPELGTYLRLAAATGARRGELCGLRWVDLDPVGGVLSIKRTVAHVRAEMFVKDTKTHAERRVALDDDTLAVLAIHEAAMTARAAACGTVLIPDAYVFTHEPDGSVPWHPGYVTLAFSRLRNKLGLSTVRLHDLRHFHATYLLAEGLSVKDVASRLGHAEAVTLNVYAHALEAVDKKAAEAMGNLLKS